VTITEGRQALAALVGRAVTFSPVSLPQLVNVKQLPAAIVRYRRLTHDVIGTGGVYEQGVEYRVTVVVSHMKVETAEASLTAALDGILAELRADPDLGGVCDDHRARSGGEPQPVIEEMSGTALLTASLDVTLINEQRVTRTA